MRFCNESANIGTFWELTTKHFKNIPVLFSFLGKGNACIRSHSNILVLNGKQQ